MQKNPSKCIGLIFMSLTVFANYSNANAHPKTIDLKHCSYTYTGDELDIAILSKGFFIAKRGKGEQTYYTRNGKLMLDAKGYIVNSNGDYVQGVGKNNGHALSEIQVPSDIEYMSFSPDGSIFVMTKNHNRTHLKQSIAIAEFDNPYALFKVTDNLFQATSESGAAKISHKNAYGAILTPYLESYPCF